MTIRDPEQIHLRLDPGWHLIRRERKRPLRFRAVPAGARRKAGRAGGPFERDHAGFEPERLALALAFV
jgi:hypothetical protein